MGASSGGTNGKSVPARGGALFLNRLYVLFLKPRSRDEDSKRREFILNILLLGSIGMLVVLDIGVLYHSVTRGDAYKEISFLTFSLIPLFFVALYAMSRRGFFAVASYLFIGIYFLSNSYAVYRWGIHLPAAALAYGLIILISSILVNTRFSFFLTAAVAVYIIPLWQLQHSGQLRIQAQTYDANDSIVFVAIYAVITIVAWLSNREIERSLSRARASEAALREERDLLDIKVEERTLELRQAQLEQVDQLYRFAEFGQLASGLFHDLVNMLNASSLNAGSTLRDAPKNAYERQALSSAQEAQGQIRRFMQAIRKQLDSQDVQESFSLTEGIDQAIQLLSYKALSRHVRIRFERSDDALMHYGNPFRFHQIMINLLQNAIESYDDYTLVGEDAPQRVTAVRVRRIGNDVALEVSDNGRGIPAHLHNSIFEPFFTTKGDEGMGIGLATTKKIVERDFGGSIHIAKHRGTGTTFAVSFPLRAEVAPL